jgi:hypothetical protein
MINLSLLFFVPTILYAEPVVFKSKINLETQKSFSNNINQNNFGKNSVNFQITKSFKGITSNIYLNYSNKQNLTFDQSFVEYKNRHKIIGIGKIHRNWSFSPHTSLILSKNARPTDSIYYFQENKQKPNNFVLSWMGPSSFEIFNSISSDQDLDNSMLMGIRAVIEPIQNIKFELVKTSQWGGDEENQDLSSFLTAIAGDTNNSKHSNINQMAGFGFSYSTNINEIPSNIYAQIIGEDEAGSLPSCLMKLVGTQFEFPADKIFSKVGFEFIDTRIDTTTNNNCGPNTAYNNTKYSYTNYGTSLGVPIDTESKSLHIWASKSIYEKININYSIKKIVINDTNWFDHRLSSSKQNGWQTNIETSWKHNAFNIKSRLSYQNFSLEKVNYNDGLSYGLNAEYLF